MATRWFSPKQNAHQSGDKDCDRDRVAFAAAQTTRSHLRSTSWELTKSRLGKHAQPLFNIATNTQ